MWCLFTRWYDDDPSIFFWTSTCIDYFPTPPPPHIYSQTQIGDRPPWPLHFSLQYVGTSTKSSINFFAWILKRKTLLSKRVGSYGVGPSFRSEIMASLLQLRLYHVGLVICMPKYTYILGNNRRLGLRKLTNHTPFSKFFSGPRWDCRPFKLFISIFLIQ